MEQDHIPIHGIRYLVQTTITATGLIAGTYTVTVTDANLCTATANAVITQPAAALTVTTSHVNVACFGGATGTATAIPAGGTGPYTYSWNTVPVQTTITATGLIAGTYTVTVTDANLCTATANVTITQPAALVATVTSQTNIGCFGDASGSVTVAGSGGVAPYLYRLGAGPYQPSGTFGSLIAGTVNITVQDANLCTFSLNITITEPAILTGFISAQTNVLCFGDASGNVTISGSGGTSPYQYRINAGGYQASGNFTGLVAGSYTITVRDANLCTTTVPVTINQPASALAGFIGLQTNVSCFGGTDGSVAITASGGTSPYQFNIDAGLFQASGTFNGLSAGIHALTVRDANNCTFNINVIITEPTPLLGTVVSQTNVLCFGDASGSIILSASGGTSPYQYSLDGGPYQASGTLNGLTAGPHAINVRDSKLCTTTINFTITQPGSAVTGSISAQTNVLCFGGATGSVTISGSGGIAPYQYSLNSGPYQATGLFTGLTAGPYVVTVRDGNLCTSNVNVTITQPITALTGSITSQTNVLCFGALTGSVTVLGSGGTTPYEYSIDGGSFQVSGTFNGLNSGSHSVSVRDANLCIHLVPVTITQPAAALTVTTSHVNVACFGGATGTATAIPAGGTGPYTYSWNTVPVQTTITATGLIAGTYTVTVTDANLCTATANAVITQPATALTVTTSQVDVACFGGTTGTATAIPAGGTGPYTYSWNTVPVQTGITATGLGAGPYTVTVTDANLCTATANVTITQPAAALTVTTSQVDVACFGGTTGTATAIPAGGTGPYTYSWNTAPVQTTITATGLGAGPYTVTITDANLCTATANVTITHCSSTDSNNN